MKFRIYPGFEWESTTRFGGFLEKNHLIFYIIKFRIFKKLEFLFSRIKHKTLSVYNWSNMLAHKFAHCTAEVKVTLFKAFWQTFYASSLWVIFTQKACNSLCILYNNEFGLCLGFLATTVRKACLLTPMQNILPYFTSRKPGDLSVWDVCFSFSCFFY